MVVGSFTSAVLLNNGKLIARGATFGKYDNNGFAIFNTGDGNDWADVAASNYNIYAIKKEGTLWAQGINNNAGQ